MIAPEIIKIKKPHKIGLIKSWRNTKHFYRKPLIRLIISDSQVLKTPKKFRLTDPEILEWLRDLYKEEKKIKHYATYKN